MVMSESERIVEAPGVKEQVKKIAAPMSGIAILTIRRLQEPAFLILFMLGALLAYGISDAGAMDISLFGVVTIAGEKGAHAPPEAGLLVGTLVLTVLGCLITVFTATCEIPRDISTRMIAILLSKPISRAEYVGGKFLGSLGIGLIFSVLWLTIMIGSRLAWPPPHQSSISVIGLILQYRCLLILLPITAIAVSISCYMSDLSAMIVSAFYILFAFGISVLPILINLIPSLIGKLLLFGYLFTPNLGYFIFGPHGFFPNLALVVYAVSSSFLFINIGRLYFEQGDIG